MLWATDEAIDDERMLLAFELDLSDCDLSVAVELARRANLSLVVLLAQKLRI